MQSCFALKNSKRKFVILNNLSGVLVPSRFTLLLGPPASGKSTLLKALSNQLRRSSGAKVQASWETPDCLKNVSSACRQIVGIRIFYSSDNEFSLSRRGGGQVYGSIKYNGLSFDQFASERAAVYVEQTDEQIALLTVRDTLEFAARCQGTGNYSRK